MGSATEKREIEYEIAEGIRPVYSLEFQCAFTGDPVEGFNKAAPEAGAALHAAVDGAQKALEEHGFVVCRTGYGVRRVQ